MELRAYWKILKRRWLVVLIPSLVVLALAIITYSRPGPLYNAGVRFIVGQDPTPSTFESDEQRLANWKTSEYIVNTLADWVKGGQFAELVSQDLAAQAIIVDPIAIRDSVATDSTRSMMVMSMTFGDGQQLEQMMHAAARVLMSQNQLGLPQLSGENASLVQLDQPIVVQVPRSILDQLELPLRIGLALASGIGLALLVEYLDPTVRGRKELDLIGLEVMGVIPKK